MEESTDAMPAWYQEFLRKEALFKNVTYPAMGWEEKIAHWVGSIHEMMRSLSSSGGDPYEGFNPIAYAEWQATEPRMDEILELLDGQLEAFDRQRMWQGIRGA
jgi:hypothetical protein